MASNITCQMMTIYLCIILVWVHTAAVILAPSIPFRRNVICVCCADIQSKWSKYTLELHPSY